MSSAFNRLLSRYRCGDEKYVAPAVIGNEYVPVLLHWWGATWNEDSMLALHQLRPSAVRVLVFGVDEEKSDGCEWRVTVYLTEDGKKVRMIKQEVEIGVRL